MKYDKIYLTTMNSSRTIQPTNRLLLETHMGNMSTVLASSANHDSQERGTGVILFVSLYLLDLHMTIQHFSNVNGSL